MRRRSGDIDWSDRLFLLGKEALDCVLHEAGYGHRTDASRNRSDYRSLWLDGIEIHVAAELSCLRIPVDSDIDNYSALRNHVGSDEFRTTDGDHEDLSLAAYCSKVLGP